MPPPPISPGTALPHPPARPPARPPPLLPHAQALSSGNSLSSQFLAKNMQAVKRLAQSGNQRGEVFAPAFGHVQLKEQRPEHVLAVEMAVTQGQKQTAISSHKEDDEFLRQNAAKGFSTVYIPDASRDLASRAHALTQAQLDGYSRLLTGAPGKLIFVDELITAPTLVMAFLIADSKLHQKIFSTE